MKIKLFVLMVLVSFTITASVDRRDEMVNAIAELNAEMPMSMGSLGVLTSATVNQDTIIYNLTMSELANTLSEKAKINKIDKKYLFNMLALTSELEPQMANFFKMIAECNLYVKYQFYDISRSTQKAVLLTPKEMYEIAITEPDYRNITEHLVEDTQKSLPITISGMTISNIRIEDNKVITDYIIDENVASFENMKNNVDFIKDTYLQTLRRGAEPSALFSSYAMAKAGYSQIYKYIGSQCGDIFLVGISPEDILNNLK